MRSTLLFALFFSYFAHAQTSKWEYGFSVNPALTAAIITNDGNTPSWVDSAYNKIEISNVSLSASGFVEYKLCTHSVVGLGLGFQKSSNRTKKLDLIYGYDPQTGEPLYEAGQPHQVRFVYSNYYLEMPLYYKLLLGKRCYLLAGTSAQLNLTNTITSVAFYENNKVKRNTTKDNSTDFRFLNVTGNLGFGIDYLQRERFSLYLQPYCQYQLLGISKSASLNRHYLSFGLVTGVRLKTKKEG